MFNPVTEAIGDIVAVDLMFINSVPYFTSVDLCSGCITVKRLYDKHAKSIAAAIVDMSHLYKRQGHKLRMLTSDQESGIKSLVVDHMTAGIGVILSPTCTQQHVASIERAIRTIKSNVLIPVIRIMAKSCK